MDDLNYLQILFSLMTLAMLLMSGLMNTFEKYLPAYIKRSFRYGKFAYKDKKDRLFKPPEVPKSWFKHFYVYSSILTISTLTLLVFVFSFNATIPSWLVSALDDIGGSTRRSTVSSASAFLAMTLLTLQCCRRFYDTQYVSVFGKNSRMNLSHYFVGFTHYTGAVIAILLEAPKFSRSTASEAILHGKGLTYIDISATLLFLWACWHQYKVAVILGNLRKNRKGLTITDSHKLPHGDWFEYVSSPHLLAEILMYFALTVILWNNVTWLYIFAWVLTNQVETALMSHWWYQETFADFPKHRKAIIPFIY